MLVLQESYQMCDKEKISLSLLFFFHYCHPFIKHFNYVTYLTVKGFNSDRNELNTFIEDSKELPSINVLLVLFSSHLQNSFLPLKKVANHNYQRLIQKWLRSVQ